MLRTSDLSWYFLVLVACHSGEPLGFFAAGPQGGSGAASLNEGAGTAQRTSDASSNAAQDNTTPAAEPRLVPDMGRVHDEREIPEAGSSPSDRTGPAVHAVLGNGCSPRQLQCEQCDACAGEEACTTPTDCALGPCDAGSCGDAGAPLGAACASNGECESGFCVDGSCCDSACDGDCQRCGADGRCNVSPALDFDCEAVRCPLATTCRSYIEPPLNRCAEVGRCAGVEDCVVHDAAANVVCGDGLVCDGNGECVPGDGSVPIVPTPVSPASKCNGRGVADGATYYYCYDFAGNVMARGFASPEGYLELFMPPAPHGGRSGSIFAFDEHGNELCGYLPAQGTGYFVARGSSCVGAVTFDFYASD